MKRIYIILTLLFVVANLIYSQEVSEMEAKEAALQFFATLSHRDESTRNKMNVSKDNISSKPLEIKMLSATRTPSIYKVQFEEGGWALVASDKRVKPILAYSSTGVFEENSIPNNLQWLLSYYESIIDSVKSLNDMIIYDDWNTLSELPLLTTTTEIKLLRMDSIRWGQSSIKYYFDDNCSRSYNKLCPVYPDVVYPRCDHAVAGCVAVAMGQVMCYWKWPLSATVPDTVYQNGVWNTPQTYRDSYYKWNNIPNVLTINSSNDEWYETDKLLRDCGYSVKMNYGATISTAYSKNYLRSAMKNNFGYSEIQLVYMADYSTSEWESILRNEIGNLRPIIYNGYLPIGEDGGGHTFIIYGFDNSHHFYMNFGWNGSYNGAYALDSIITGNNNLTRAQEAFIGIEPNYCSIRKINPNEIWDNSFDKHYIGNIEIGDRIIGSTMTGSITASNSVVLTDGFEIQQGGDVEIYIDGLSCSDVVSENYIQNSITLYNNLLIDTNDRVLQPVKEIPQETPVDTVVNGTDDIDVQSIQYFADTHTLSMPFLGQKQVEIYTLTGGQLFYVVTKTETIQLPTLSQGIYVLRISTTDNQTSICMTF